MDGRCREGLSLGPCARLGVGVGVGEVVGDGEGVGVGEVVGDGEELGVHGRDRRVVRGVRRHGFPDSSLPPSVQRGPRELVPRRHGRRSYDRRRARGPPLHRGRSGAPRTLGRLGAVPAALAGDALGGRGRGRSRPFRLQGRRAHLPARLPRGELRRDGRAVPRALAPTRGGGRTHAAPRQRPGDVRRRFRARCRRRCPRGRRRAGRAAGPRRGRPKVPGNGGARVRALRTRIGCPGGRRLSACPARDRRLLVAHRHASDLAAPAARLGHRGHGGQTCLRGRCRRRLRRSLRPRAARRRSTRGGGAVVAPSGLLRARVRRRPGPPARLHRVGGRHDLRPAGARRRAARRPLQGVTPHRRHGPRPVRPHRPGALRRRPGASSPA